MTTMMMSVARINYLTEWPLPPSAGRAAAGVVGGRTGNKNQVDFFQPPSPTLFVLKGSWVRSKVSGIVS